MSARQGGIQCFLHEGPARPADCVDAGVQSLRNLAVVPARAGIGGVRLQQHTRLEQLPRSVFAVLDQRIQSLTLRFAEPNDELASGLWFRGHDVSPLGQETSIQTNSAKSMTRGTRARSQRNASRTAIVF